ncbi:MAG: hypothetical protein EBR63_00890 [Actinobacteria bacterium]|nr:hypothetical protein [Actinomycetota bacterium]
MNFVLILSVGTVAGCVVVAKLLGQPIVLRRRVARRLKALRLTAAKKSPRRWSLEFPRLPFRRVQAHIPEERLAALLDVIARELRLGSSVNAALLTAMSRRAVPTLAWLVQPAQSGETLHVVIARHLAAGQPHRRVHQRRLESGESTRLALRAIATAADGGDPVHAIEAAARTLRSNAAIAADSRAAVSYTRTSMNVLTWIPLVIAAWLISRDHSVRDFFSSAFGAWCLAVGVGLNALGRYVVARMTTAAARGDSETSDLVDTIAVHLRAGTPPATAFRAATETTTGDLAECGRLVMTTHDSGARFVDALEMHRDRFPLRTQQLIDALIDTERAGLSTRELFDRLAADAHAQRRREAEQRIRSLPVRLTLPLVGCVLPAYALIAVVPLIASQLTSVTYDPHPLTGGTP